MSTTDTSKTSALPRLPLDSPEAIDRAVVHAFWSMKALIRALDDADEDTRPDAEEQARRRAVMARLGHQLETSVCTSASTAPRAGHFEGE